MSELRRVKGASLGSTAGCGGQRLRMKTTAAPDCAVAARGEELGLCTPTPQKKGLNPPLGWGEDSATHRGDGRASCCLPVSRIVHLSAGGVFS